MPQFKYNITPSIFSLPRTENRLSLDALDEAVTNLGQGVLKVGKGLGLPVGAVGTGNGLLALEGNVEHIVLVVTGVAVDALAVAGLANGEGSLADQRRAVITVGVTPNTVKL